MSSIIILLLYLLCGFVVWLKASTPYIPLMFEKIMWFIACLIAWPLVLLNGA